MLCVTLADSVCCVVCLCGLLLCPVVGYDAAAHMVSPRLFEHACSDAVHLPVTLQDIDLTVGPLSACWCCCLLAQPPAPVLCVFCWTFSTSSTTFSTSSSSVTMPGVPASGLTLACAAALVLYRLRRRRQLTCQVSRCCSFLVHTCLPVASFCTCKSHC
jgi:hypothetical protein